MLKVLCASMLLVVLLPGGSWAQQTGDPSVSTAGKPVVGEEAATVGEPEADTAAQEGVQEGVKAPPGGAPLPAGAGSEPIDQPPDEYRASEEISDDSSVSFPVDI